MKSYFSTQRRYDLSVCEENRTSKSGQTSEMQGFGSETTLLRSSNYSGTDSNICFPKNQCCERGPERYLFSKAHGEKTRLSGLTTRNMNASFKNPGFFSLRFLFLFIAHGHYNSYSRSC